MNPNEAYLFGLLPLVVWREAKNQSYEAMIAVAWSIMNRVTRNDWEGHDCPSVILKHYQYSSFNWNDPNSQQFPKDYSDSAWTKCLSAAHRVFYKIYPDPTNGAVNYYDKSLDSNPPKWAKDMIHTVDIGAFHFYK